MPEPAAMKSLGSPVYLFGKENAYEDYFSSGPKKSVVAFSLLNYLLLNDQSNRMAVGSGLSGTLSNVFTAEAIDKESNLGKLFINAVAVLKTSMREETMVIQFSEY